MSKDQLIEKLISKWLIQHGSHDFLLDQLIKINSVEVIANFFGHELHISLDRYLTQPISESFRGELNKLNYYELERMWFMVL